jgi:hypothetical protein
LLHYSANETNQPRYCLFVDMVRPTPFPGVMRAVMSGIRLLTQSFKFVYYQNWKLPTGSQKMKGSIALAAYLDRSWAERHLALVEKE